MTQVVRLEIVHVRWVSFRAGRLWILHIDLLILILPNTTAVILAHVLVMAKLWALHPAHLMLQVLHFVIPGEFSHNLVTFLVERWIEGIRTVREATHVLISYLRRQLGRPDRCAVVRLILVSSRLYQLSSVDELTGAWCVVFGVFNAFLVDSAGLRQVTVSAHLIDHLQVSVYLVGSGQADHVRAPLDLTVQILNLIIDIHLLCGLPVKVYALIVQSIKVALNIGKTWFAFCSCLGRSNGSPESRVTVDNF